MATQWLKLEPHERRLELHQPGTIARQVHVFEEFDAPVLDAVNTSLAAGRPLLVRGEPGVGKSQLALASAHALGRAFIPYVIDNRTEARDLMYRSDAVARLSEAQLVGALGRSTPNPHDVRARLDPLRFVTPGPLWWAFDWASARQQLALRRGQLGSSTDMPAVGLANADETDVPAHPPDWKPGDGVVVLLDEIDKAETDVPNGLLECLGEGRFRPLGWHKPVSFAGGLPALIVITTNEERALPDAFVRRCVVLHLELPDASTQRAALVNVLSARGRAHFPDLDVRIIERAAELLAEDRELATREGLARPGQAEYLDLLRAVRTLFESTSEREAALARLSRFTTGKHNVSSR